MSFLTIRGVQLAADGRKKAETVLGEVGLLRSDVITLIERKRNQKDKPGEQWNNEAMEAS